MFLRSTFRSRTTFLLLLAIVGSVHLLRPSADPSRLKRDVRDVHVKPPTAADVESFGERRRVLERQSGEQKQIGVQEGVVAGATSSSVAVVESTRTSLDEPSTTEQLSPVPTGSKRFAYVFYAAEDAYACSALLNIQRLRRLGTDKTDSPYTSNDIDYVLLYVPGLVSETLINRANKQKVTLKPVKTLPGPTNEMGYYHDVLVKLRVFQLTEYRRIIFMDSDTLVFKSLDHLFALPSCDVAAPRAYWIKQPFVASTLLVVEPSEALWRRLLKHIEERTENAYDMDIINEELGNEALVLPNIYGLLNSHWEANDTKPFGDLDRLFDVAYLAHFTALGKPWNYPPESVDSMRPGAHRLFRRGFEMWWEERKDVGC